MTVFFNYKLIIKNVLYQPMLFTAFVKRETFLAQLFLWYTPLDVALLMVAMASVRAACAAALSFF